VVRESLGEVVILVQWNIPDALLSGSHIQYNSMVLQVSYLTCSEYAHIHSHGALS